MRSREQNSVTARALVHLTGALDLNEELRRNHHITAFTASTDRGSDPQTRSCAADTVVLSESARIDLSK